MLHSLLHYALATITISDNGIINSGTGFSSLNPAGVFSVVANTIIFLTGAISVIMILVGAIRYVVSAGNSGAVAKAKDTIIYALVGLVGAAMGYAAIRFIGNFFK